NDGTINLLDLDKMTLTPTTMVGQFNTANSPDVFDFSHDDRLLIVQSEGRSRLWDLLANRERALPAGMSCRWGGLPTLSPDGRILAGPSTNFAFKLWDLQTQRELATLKGHAWVVNYGRFSPDGKLLATFGWESFVRLWRVPSGRSAAPPFRGHKEGAFYSDFSPDGKTLATSTTEFTTRLWHVQTGQELMALEGTREPIFAPDGNTLALRTRSDEIRLLRAPSLAEIDA